MRSPTAALLWDIWRRHRGIFVVVVAATVIGRLIEARSAPAQSSLAELLRLISFVLVFGIFSYTESVDNRGLGRFPQRLFVLPVSSLRLIAIPVLAGCLSVELLYLMWLDPASAPAFTNVVLNAVLLGTLMVCCQAVVWTLDRLGPLRLVVIGLLTVAAFWIGLLPFSAPSPPPWWRTELGLAVSTAVFAVVVFLGTWRRVGRSRSGDSGAALAIDAIIATPIDVVPRRRRPFRSPAAAHFWFEWRSSGVVLPMLVAGVLLTVIAPLSWTMRDDSGDTLRLLVGTLTVPVLLSAAVGIGFAKPSFWSQDLAMPAFVAVRPLSDEEIVATKIRTAMVSVAISWVVLLSFVAMWLPLWGNLDALSQFAIQLWAFHGHSVTAVYGIGALVVTAGIFATWRFLVSRLWAGLSGRRPLFLGSAMFIGLAVITGLIFDGTRLPGWMLDDPAHMNAIVFIAAGAVIGKYCLAAYAWRRVDPRYVRQYLFMWLMGTVAIGALGLVFWGIARIYLAVDIYRFQTLLILLALLTIPVARIGFAPAFLAWNRHR